ncbi:hypothetical protein KBB25_01175 [Candidatus Gracilibacteria bacterium]|nr:hypothetical protein [Candidatus Gracilibacteria bacterium]
MRIRLVIFLIISSFCFTSNSLFAADIYKANFSQIPSGYSMGGDGWYTSSSSSDRYKVSSNTSSSSAGDINGSILGEDYSQKARSGNFSYTDIPSIIATVISNLLALTGGICVVALIYHALRMQLASGITGDSSHVDHAKDGIKGSIIGFVLSMSAWFIMTKFVEILSNVS